MKRSYRNPFGYGRRETEQQKGFDIFVPRSVPRKDDSFAFFRWISGEHFLFEGIRGSGKTSILKSMHWTIAWVKNYKEKVKGGKEIEDYFYGEKLPKHIGVIFKCDKLDNEIWKDWSEIYGVKYGQRIFSIYLEYSHLYLLLNALSSIIFEKPEILAENWYQEELITKEILSSAFPEKKIRPLLQKNSFYDLSILFREKTGIIRSQICKEVPYESIVVNLNLDDAGKIIQFLGEKINEIPTLKDTLIFPMIDDCERLKPWQAKVVGNFIFRASHPISYKITAMMDLDNITHTTDNRPITEHELKRVPISGSTETDWETNSSFYNLFNGILQTRINHIYGSEFSKLFDLKKLVGNPNIEKLVIEVISESRGKDAIKFYESFISQKTEKSIINYFMKKRGIIDELQYDSGNESLTERKLRKRKNYTEINKRRQVAAIAMFKTKEFENIRFPYAGLDTILKLCCGSIRELLRIMYEIWKEAHLPIDDFVNHENLSFEIQNKAIRNASNSFWNSIVSSDPILNTDWDKNLTAQPPTSPKLICYRLGNLFSLFQSCPYICESNEIGSIKIEIYSPAVEYILDYLLMAGVLIKKGKKTEKNIKIALHPYFAPIFGLSPRHPFYYSKSISKDDFEVLIKGSDDAYNERILKKDDRQMMLNLEN